jgi:UDP-GlcNAc:polypeptide alpha-N-acetylglucosaminyltransferase
MMRRNESFYMMIDSHNRFTRFWDLRAITQVMNLIKGGVSKPVLSHYPDAWRNPGDPIEARNGEGGAAGSKAGNATIGPQPPLDGRRATAYLCKAKFLQTGIPRLDGLMVPVTLDKRPRPQPWAAAGFIFAPAKLPSEVPFDPYLDYLFDGEEILYSVRMWTHGWDIYSPGENILFHYYYRRKSKRVFQDTRGWAPSQLRSIHRVQHILKLNPVRPDLTSHSRVTGVGPPPKNSRVFLKLDVYGLGTNRTLKQYWEYAGGDPVKRTFDKDFCKKHYNG